MAKTSAKKSVKAVKKAGNRKPKRSWNVYARRTLKGVNAKLSFSSKTLKIVNSFVNDIFERLATEAAHLVRVNKKSTLGSKDIQTAVRLSLPTDLAQHAMSEGTRAVSKLA